MFRPIESVEGILDATAAAVTVSQARTGDPEALRTLYERHYRSIYNVVYRMVNRREDAVDLTAEVFLRAFQNLKHLKTDEAFGGWLRRVAVNLCLDHVKRKAPPTISIDTTYSGDEESERRTMEIADGARGPDKLILADEMGEQVQEALAALSPNHRAVILLHHVDGKEVKEIAQIMGCSEGTVKSRLGRARENLRSLLQDYMRS